MSRKLFTGPMLLVVMTLALAVSGAGFAGASTDFSGKTIKLIVAYPAGGNQDLEARVMAQVLPKHIPGNPRILVVNMPGAGGLQAVKYVYSAVEPDGLALGFFGASPPTEQLMADYVPTGRTLPGVDIGKFNWLGSSGGRGYVFVVRSDTPYKTIDDLLKAPNPVKAGATRPGSTTFVGPALLRETLDAPIDIITGYRGGSDRDLAFFRGETQSQYGSFSSLTTRNRDWLEEKLVRPLLLFGQKIPAEDLEAAFATSEIPHIRDLVKKPEDVALIDLAMAPGQWGRLIAAPPGTPSQTVEVLRKAVSELAKDPEFKAAVEKRGMSLSPLTGDEVDKRIRRYLDTDPATIEHFLNMVEES